MYVLDDDGIKCECVVTDEGNDVLEIKNIATVPEYQGKGYAKALIDFVVEKYRAQYAILQVGTGDSPLTIPFYENIEYMDAYDENERLEQDWEAVMRYTPKIIYYAHANEKIL